MIKSKPSDGRPTKETMKWVKKRWHEMMAELPGELSLGTQHLSDEVVNQDLAVYVGVTTDPENPRKGIAQTAIRLSSPGSELFRDNPKLTADEVEYVVSSLLNAARTIAQRGPTT